MRYKILLTRFVELEFDLNEEAKRGWQYKAIIDGKAAGQVAATIAILLERKE